MLVCVFVQIICFSWTIRYLYMEHLYVAIAANTPQLINTDRSVTIYISNSSSQCTLKHPRIYTYSGYCQEAPHPIIAKNTQKSCSFTKTTCSLYGSDGVLTYQILNDRNDCIGELAIMFSVPYNYKTYGNCFALGIFEPECPCDVNLYNKMYHESGTFTRGNGTGSSIKYSRNAVTLEGTMSPQSQSKMIVELCDVFCYSKPKDDCQPFFSLQYYH
ncbi:DELTA-thalatoxin-Avl1a-like [Astyanax mexicanus]|uniref:DELTA-thalatoxin-Avl1a-like n=1 Tax=Astyanax mexicanus TaxID=7994 RepID=A0A8T2L9D6_ASTMX|nr:DELTA-thalatoxin-Avl1a-like [Astyanax mexicanus]